MTNIKIDPEWILRKDCYDRLNEDDGTKIPPHITIIMIVVHALAVLGLYHLLTLFF